MTTVVALGGNALLRRGEEPSVANQARAARAAAERLAPAAAAGPLVVTHGNGPQVGLLALLEPHPLDVLDAESIGQIGYLLEMALDNAVARDTVAVITRVVVDGDDPGFQAPTKFIGPVYDTPPDHPGWTVKRDGDRWRRVVASPEPRRIVQLDAIRALVDDGFLVVCAGGGGVPVLETAEGHRGVEAVIDKDLVSALLAAELGADLLVLATDVDAVYAGFGSPDQRAIGVTTPEELRATPFPAGSMGPKVEAACRFVERTGARAAIGALDHLDDVLAGRAGTQINPQEGHR